MALLIGAGTVLTYTYYFPLRIEETRVINEVNIEEKDRIKDAIDQVYDAVVLLETYLNNRLIGTGTGFIYKQDIEQGYIMTNHHVVDKGTRIIATLANGKEVEVKVLSSDEMLDLAVLSIPKEDIIQIAKIGTTDSLELGDTLFTVGSPLGKQYMGTVTKGILSGKDRTVTVSLSNGAFIMEVLQTDAAINPGNSGGPLLNINGEVIGINSLKVVKDEIEGMGFAIPIDLAMSFVPRLEKGEKIERPMIGLSLIDVTNTYALFLSEISINNPSLKEGVVIAEIEEETPSSEADFEVGDVIVSINGVKTKDLAHFRFNLYKYKVGDTITIRYYRGTVEKTTQILLNKSL
jgi:serine protease Do